MARGSLAVDFGDRGREIAVYDIARGLLTRLTFTQEVNLFPCWTPDGKFIAFESSSPTGDGIAVVRADGGGAPIRLLEHPGIVIPWSFSPDGTTLAYHQAEASTGFDIWTAPVTTRADGFPQLGRPVPFATTPFAE
jgi:Tol biopolymer transport system component